MTLLRIRPHDEIATISAPAPASSSVAYEGALQELLADAQVDRESVLRRVDRDTLVSAPFSLLLSTAISLAPQDAAELTEDAVLRQTAALIDEHTSIAAHARLLAETFVLANVEHQNAISTYTAAEEAVPSRQDFTNPQHYLEALKIHERRMDRLLRARKDAFDRLQKASETYREALLTRDGLEVLRTVTRQRTTASQSTVGDVVSSIAPTNTIKNAPEEQKLHIAVSIK